MRDLLSGLNKKKTSERDTEKMCEVNTYTRATIPDRVKNLIRGQFRQTCKAQVVKRHGVETLETTDIFVVSTRSGGALRSKGARDQVCGFAMIRIEPDHLYVQILCANKPPGTGRLIMDAVEEIAERRGKNLIKLTSLDTAIGFYKKLGYTERYNDCSPREREVRIGSMAHGFRMSKCTSRGGGRRASRPVRRTSVRKSRR